MLFSQLLLDVCNAHEVQLVDTVPWPAEKRHVFAEQHPLVELIGAKKERVLSWQSWCFVFIFLSLLA